MNIRITFKDTEHSSATEEIARKQLAKVVDFLTKEDRSPVYIDLILMPSHVHSHHLIELRVKSPNYDRYSSYEGKDFGHTLDRVIDVMYKELHEDKKRMDDQKKSRGRHEEFKKER